ncbi:MAG: polymer-forming cytoskeletal protein [Alphaproteobacteria bacterium]|nr:polymer-forming cytoskeletal protein [Alphaproteobacteria bacterium]
MAQTTKRGKTVPSILSSDLHIYGQIMTKGEMQIDSMVQGDMRASFLTIGESAHIDGEVAGDEITVKGRVKGTIRGRRVHLCATCHVDGDIFHEALAVESGAFFNGTVCREKDPLAKAKVQAQNNDNSVKENTAPSQTEAQTKAQAQTDRQAKTDTANLPI